MSTDETPTERDPDQANLETLRARLAAAADWLRGFLYGMTTYEQVLTLRKQRADLEHLFVLISFGDLLGVPVLPPYYTLRLLPSRRRFPLQEIDQCLYRALLILRQLLLLRQREQILRLGRGLLVLFGVA